MFLGGILDDWIFFFVRINDTTVKLFFSEKIMLLHFSVARTCIENMKILFHKINEFN